MQNLVIQQSMAYLLTSTAPNATTLFLSLNKTSNTQLESAKLVIFEDNTIIGLSTKGRLILTEVQIQKENNEVAMNIFKRIKDRVPIGDLIKEHKCIVKSNKQSIYVKFRILEVTKHNNEQIEKYLVQYDR